MTAQSPNLIGSGMVAFTIQSDGKKIDSTIGVESIETWSRINKVPHARLVVYDGSAAKQDFEVSSQKVFKPGAKIDISLGYTGKPEALIFSGIVTGIALDIQAHGSSKLVVDIYDEALKMTLDRKNAVFEKIKDSDLIGKLIGNSGLKKSVSATSFKHAEIVQYYASDWDMMLLRAEANGLVVVTQNSKITVAQPDTAIQPALVATFGESIIHFYAELNSATQFASSAIDSSAWDPGQQKVIGKKAAASRITEPGNLSSKDLAKVFGVKDFAQQSSASLELPSLGAWSDAEFTRASLSKIIGSVSFQGSSKAQTGTTIELAGVGDRFNGTAYISGVHHSVKDGVWVSEVQFGLSAESYAEITPNIAAPDAAGLIPPVKGLQPGLVKKIAKDPAGEFRVGIELPLLQAAGKIIWARLASFYASRNIGAEFYPEVNDEVIVGFMNDDPRFPVILGSAYSKKNPPPVAPDEKNRRKVLTTRSKLEIAFDEQDKIIEIKTPGNNFIRLDEKAKKILISDQNKNSVALEKGGITLDSAAKITLKSKSDIVLQAGANFKVSAKANADFDAAQISHKAKSKFAASGNGMAELKSSGIVTVKGAMIKLN